MGLVGTCRNRNKHNVKVRSAFFVLQTHVVIKIVPLLTMQICLLFDGTEGFLYLWLTNSNTLVVNFAKHIQIRWMSIIASNQQQKPLELYENVYLCQIVFHQLPNELFILQ